MESDGSGESFKRASNVTISPRKRARQGGLFRSGSGSGSGSLFGSGSSSRSSGRDELGHIPSEVARMEVFCKYPPGTYMCYRPEGNKPPYPLALLEEGFMKFRTECRDTSKVDSTDIKLADELTRILNSKEYVFNHKQGVTDVNELLESYLKLAVVTSIVRGNVATDGSIFVGRSVVLLLEHEAEMGKSGDPYLQGNDYIRRECRKHGSSGEDATHGLLLCIMGPYIQVSAFFYEPAADRVWCEPLTYILLYGDTEVVKAAAGVMRAVRIFTRSYQHMAAPSTIPWKLRPYGQVVHVSKHNVFIYAREGMLVAAKFVRTYSLEAHRAWFEAGVAVRILQVEENLGDGWTLVHMEYLGDCEELAPGKVSGWRRADEVVAGKKRNKRFLRQLSEEIAKAVSKGHSMGFVHGDLRLPNVMVHVGAEGQVNVKIIDFDWAGRISAAYYPVRPNPDIAWPPGVDYGKAITVQHDLWWPRKLVNDADVNIFQEPATSDVF